MHIGFEIVYARVCSAIFSVGVFLNEHAFFFEQGISNWDDTVFQWSIKHHAEYLFNLFSFIGLTFRGPQNPSVFSGLMNFRLICACLSHL